MCKIKDFFIRKLGGYTSFDLKIKIDNFAESRIIDEEKNAKRFLILEQTELILYLISELLENHENHEKLEKKEIANLMKSARWFTKHAFLDASAMEDKFQIESRKKFIEYLSRDMWMKIYNRPYEE